MIRPIQAAALVSWFLLPSVAHAQPADLKEAAHRYGAAWASRDPERIAALHTPDTEFRLFVSGVPTAEGRDAVEAAFGSLLASNPTYASTVDRMRFGRDFVVIEYRIRMDPETTVRLGRHAFAPTGASYEVDAVDLIEFRDGLVSLKHTFLDVEAMRDASPKVTEVARR